MSFLKNILQDLDPDALGEPSPGLQERWAILGGGAMGEALIQGLFREEDIDPSDLVVTAKQKDHLEYLRKRYEGTHITSNNMEAIHGAMGVVLAVRPQNAAALIQEIAPCFPKDALLVSIIAGMPLRALEDCFPAGTRIYRAMPNALAIVGFSETAITPGRHATDADTEKVKTIFNAVGNTFEVDESLMDAVTGLSGSGPGYIFTILDALTDAGVKVGLSRQQALELIVSAVLGSIQWMVTTDSDPSILKNHVTTPAGTTIAGLHALEKGGLRATLINAVEAATRRSRKLAKLFSHGALLKSKPLSS